jgi:hypothetical protein
MYHTVQSETPTTETTPAAHSACKKKQMPVSHTTYMQYSSLHKGCSVARGLTWLCIFKSTQTNNKGPHKWGCDESETWCDWHVQTP